MFFAVSSAFVIGVQPKLEPDSSERPEAQVSPRDFRLPTLLPQCESLQPQISANLLMSLLAPFITMLEKQWLDRYLHHIGRSMIEHCGEHQDLVITRRKCLQLDY